jgi:TRAP-type transport system small permease protein
MRLDDGPTARLLSPLAFIAGCAVVAMMLVTVMDVVGRYFFNAPLGGASEATELLLALIVFAGISLAAVSGEHIRIDILEHLLSTQVLRWQAVFGSIASATVLILLTWRLWLRGNELARFNDDSSHLHVPLAPLAWFMAVSCAVAAVVFLAIAWRALPRRKEES